MLHLEAVWPSKLNILLADTIWQNQTRSQVLRFGDKIGLHIWGKYFCLYHMFQTNFSYHNKI